MAKGWEDITSASVSAGSGAIGAGLAAGGLPVAGAAVAAGGQVVSGLMNLFKPVPKLPGPSGAQFVAAERAEATASKAAGMEGISPAEVAALDDLTLRRNLRSTAVANAYNSVYALGPAEQEILVDRIVTQQQSEASSLRSEYLMMDEEAIRRNMQLKLASNAEAERQATNIRSMEINKEIGEMAMEREKWTNFIQGMGDSAELVAGAIDMADAKEAALAKEKKDMQHKTALNTATKGAGQEMVNLNWGDPMPDTSGILPNMNAEYLANPTSDKSKGDRNRLIIMENAPDLYPKIYRGQ
jgi:hypothetical protein